MPRTSVSDLPPAGLRTFAAVLDAGTVEAAATDLGISPSAVSQRLKALEAKVGTVLLQRTKPVSPTPTGHIIARLARQYELIGHDAANALGELSSVGGRTRASIVINSDALATWLLEPLTSVAARRHLLLDLIREDEAHSLDHLRRGEAMAAISSQDTPVQGCTVTHLGTWEYWPVAHPAFIDRHLRGGFTARNAARAPIVRFDAKDTAPEDYLSRMLGKEFSPPENSVPDARQYTLAIAYQLGWGLMPDHFRELEPALAVLRHVPEAPPLPVDLYWHQWAMESETLEALRTAVAEAARRDLAR